VDIKRPYEMNVYAELYLLNGIIIIIMLIVERLFSNSERLGCSIYSIYMCIYSIMNNDIFRIHNAVNSLPRCEIDCSSWLGR
jgi:hypothetical protein